MFVSGFAYVLFFSNSLRILRSANPINNNNDNDNNHDSSNNHNSNNQTYDYKRTERQWCAATRFGGGASRGAEKLPGRADYILFYDILCYLYTFL